MLLNTRKYRFPWKHHISTEDLTRRLGLDTVDFYVARRQLGWLAATCWRAWTTRGYLVGCYRARWRTSGRAAPRA